MGRYIHAEQVGMSMEDLWVYKFWLGVQPTDVSDYLEAHEVTTTVASLEVSQRDAIKATVAELEEKFQRKYGISYDEYMETDEPHEIAENRETRAKQLLASRINLGEHLLLTIENMEERGIDEQELVIDY